MCRVTRHYLKKKEKEENENKDAFLKLKEKLKRNVLVCSGQTPKKRLENFSKQNNVMNAFV